MALYSQILKLLSDIYSSTHLSLISMPTTIQTAQVSQSRPPPSQPWATMLMSCSLSSLEHYHVWTASQHPHPRKGPPSSHQSLQTTNINFFFSPTELV